MGAPMTTQNIPGSHGLPLIGSWLGVAEFMRGWQAFFLNRRERAGAEVFKANLGIKTIAILDPRPMQVLFDKSKVKKRYGFGAFGPHPKLVGRITPTVFTNDADHVAQKTFWMAVQRERAMALDGICDEAIDRALHQWNGGGFNWDEALQGLCADILYRWLIDVEGPTADAETWMSNVLTKVAFGSKFRASRSAWERMLHLVETSPGFERAAELAAEQGMSRELAAKTLTFSLAFNAWAGMVGFARSTVAELSQNREKTGDIDQFLLEVLRLYTPVKMVYGETLAPTTLVSKGRSYEVDQGELLMGVLHNAHRDPEIFKNPTAFEPSRFDDAQCLEHLYWAGGPQTQTPGSPNKICPGRDVATRVIGKLATRLLDYEWSLDQAPVWSDVTYPKAGGPAVPLDVRHFKKR